MPTTAYPMAKGEVTMVAGVVLITAYPMTTPEM